MMLIHRRHAMSRCMWRVLQHTVRLRPYATIAKNARYTPQRSQKRRFIVIVSVERYIAMRFNSVSRAGRGAE